ncbi:MAG: ABC transporter permease [Gammaproteobacteria bacterium]|nr:ABC transporter permease [Gammaproteobacteria bacterium]MDH4314794.1 ABC transporter permease [Gammaproteobacteria bacterium]MDH5214765.1 ABC transporter permease [Gammaproteobacteria bacterium]MDH5501283.1 ABC transporter permease [Gammaproteobacteria bacterium]
MAGIQQVVAVSWLNILNLPQRIATSLVAVIGVAAVVLVFAAILSMAKGFERTMVAAGSDDTAIILRSGSTAELNSGLSNDSALIIENSPGIVKEGNRPITSAELYVVVDVRKKSTDADANVPFRGVQPSAMVVRPNVRLVDGRLFEQGKNEIIVGRAAQLEFDGLEVGSTIRFGQTNWAIVGTFEADGSVSESELWTDVRVLQGAYRRGTSYQSVRVKLDNTGSIVTLKETLDADPRVDVDVMSEKDYYSSQAEPLSRFIRLIGYPLTILMAIGAVFGALNSMYSSVSVRGKEIATLRALGFGPISVLVSTIIESTVLALAGGLLGGAAAYLLFNGFRVSTLNGASFSQVVFDFAVTPELLVQGLAAAAIIGLIGGFFPAIRAARLPVAQALREV